MIAFWNRLPLTRGGRRLAEDLRLLKSSAYFDEPWYRQQYGEVLGPLSCTEHYLLHGKEMGFDPGPLFSTKGYLQAHADVAQAGMNPLVHFLRYGQYEGRFPTIGNSALALEETLWAGMGEQNALDGLRAILANETLPDQERVYATWALVRWHGSRGEWRDVEPLLRRLCKVDVRFSFLRALPLVEVDALIKSGAFDRAEKRLDALIESQPGHGDFLLARANWLSGRRVGANERLDCLNALFQKSGLALLALKDPQARLKLGNLRSVPAVDHIAASRQMPLVSVLVPAFNAEKTLSTALESLASQTWTALEVLIIDDCSADRTAAVAESFATRNPLFRLLRAPFCQGPYVARNLGLAEARGEFITVHDADDWSHPQKIALQVECLLQNPRLAASASHWVRCSEDLVFGSWRIEEGWIHRNVSSLMLRRRVLKALGYWDRVKVSADTEYYYRILQAYGPKAVAEVMPGVPLAFGRLGANSLTGTGETHERTSLGGVRKLYLDAAYAWHRQGKNAVDLHLPARPKRRPFPIPPALRVEVQEWQGAHPWHPGHRNILLVAHAASRQTFGAERCLLDVLRGLCELEANVVVALPEAENQAYLNELRRNACSVFGLPYTWWRRGRNPADGVVANFRQLIRRFEVELLYANTAVLWEPLLAARLSSVPTVVHVHELPEHDPDLCAALEADAQTLRQHVLSLADTLVANSRAVAHWMNAPERTVIVPNTLDFGRFDMPQRPAGPGFQVAMISSNVPKKGLLDFVEIARHLSRPGDAHIDCLLVGPDNGHVAALKQAQARGDVPRNLRFFGMAPDPAPALAQTDVVVNLSRFQESFGRVVLEAMAARRPVVCYSWGALPELVVDGETGFLVAYGDDIAAAERVLTLSRDPALRRAMGEAARARALELCSWPVFVERLRCSINPFQD